MSILMISVIAFTLTNNHLVYAVEDKDFECDDIEPSNITALNNEGVTYSENGQYHKAIICFSVALDNDKHNLTIISNKGLALVEIGKINRALTLVEPHINNNSKNLDLLCVYKNAYEKAGNERASIFYNSTINEIDPSHECEPKTI